MDIKSKRNVKNVSSQGGEAPLEGDRPDSGSVPLSEGALAVARPDEPPVTREQRRSRRKREVRARTISVKRMTKRELEIGRLLYPEHDYEKPLTRSECVEGMRPCPYVSCKHHLFLDVSSRTGAIKLNFPDLEVWEMNETCALDIADRGGTTLEEVGAIMNLTRERIRQVEVKALAKLDALKEMMALRDYVDEGPVGKRRLPLLSKKDLVDDEDDAPAESDDDEDDDLFEAPRPSSTPPDFDLIED
jgi:Sigma-70, region 4